MPVFDDTALSLLTSRGMVVEGYKRRCIMPDGTVQEFCIDHLRIGGSPCELEALSLLLRESDNTRSLPARDSSKVIQAPADVARTPRLTEYLDLFLKRKVGGSKEITSRTVLEYRRVVRLFIEMFKDLSVDFYTEENAVDFREKLRSLPPYVRSHLPWKGMSIEEVLQSSQVEETLSTKRIEAHLKRMNAIFKDLAERNLIKFNIFKDVQIKTDSPRKYVPFHKEELETIFSSRNVTIDLDWPSHYWVPLIALYTGMRRSEIFFRSPGDILCEGNIYYLNVHREGEKNTKNEASVRHIPIHSHLIQLGFLRFVEQVQTQQGEDARLFPEYRDYNGQAGNKFTDWFRTYRRSISIDKPGKVFHSFRSNFINELERHGENFYFIQRLAGHAIQSITHDPVNGYGGKFAIKDLKETIEKIDFQEVLLGLPKWRFEYVSR